jgi:hypothetical protein
MCYVTITLEGTWLVPNDAGMTGAGGSRTTTGRKGVDSALIANPDGGLKVLGYLQHSNELLVDSRDSDRNRMRRACRNRTTALALSM